MKPRHILMIFLIVVVIYAANNKTFVSGDTIPAKYLPLSILEEFDLDLDEFPHLYEKKTPYFLRKIGSHYYSSYPIVSSILATPVYALAKLAGIRFTEKNIHRLEKISASILAALSVVFLMLALMELTTKRNALIFSFVYAFGTCTWSCSPMGLWQHSSSQLFNALAIYLLARGTKDKKFIGYAGFCLAMGVLARPTNILVAAIMSIYVLHKHRDYFLKFIYLMMVPIAFLVLYNLTHFNHIFGGYMGHEESSNWWQSPFLLTLAGLLISPSRGLLIYSPILIVSFIGIALLWTKKDNPLLLYLSFVPIAYILLFSNFRVWWGGVCFGPRFLTDTLPFFLIVSIPAWQRLKRKKPLRIIVLLLLIYSVNVQVLGVYFNDFEWSNNPLLPSINSNMERLWSWRDSQLMYIIRKGRIPPKDIREKEYYLVEDNRIDFSSTESMKHYGYGWIFPENWGTWTIGKKSVIYLHFPEIKDMKLIIRARSFKKRRKKHQTMELYINKTFLKKYTFKHPLTGWETIEADIPSVLLTGEVEELEFIFGHAEQASYFDIRIISAGFEYIEFHSINAKNKQ